MPDTTQPKPNPATRHPRLRHAEQSGVDPGLVVPSRRREAVKAAAKEAKLS